MIETVQNSLYTVIGILIYMMYVSCKQMNVMYVLWDETVPESGGFSPDAAVPPARRQQTEQFVG